jgi:hypothetical protein
VRVTQVLEHLGADEDSTNGFLLRYCMYWVVGQSVGQFSRSACAYEYMPINLTLMHDCSCL